jgi:hypothetical protein
MNMGTGPLGGGGNSLYQTMVSNLALPVQTSNIVTSGNPINTQIVGTAPDGSGATLTQYEALVAGPSIAYGTQGLAQQAILQAAQANGCLNFVFVSGSNSSCRIICW